MTAYAAAAPIAIFLSNPAELTGHPFKFIGLLVMSGALGWIMALLPFEVFFVGLVTTIGESTPGELDKIIASLLGAT